MISAMRLTVALGLAAGLAAQTFTYPLNPRATYLRTNLDSPLPPLVLDLAALGIAPGTWLRVGTTGAFRYINGGQDTYQSLVGVFSSNNQLLASNVQQRVPGAIASGPAFPSGSTYNGGLPMDVVEDFFCSRNTWANEITVQVPAGATHLFLGVHDSLYNDNVDPNGDYAAVVSIAPNPTQPGTGEHLELRTAIGAPTVSYPDVRNATPGAPAIVEIHHPTGFLDGSLYLFVGNLIPTGAPAPNPLPGLWIGELVVLQYGVIPNTPGWTATWSASTPGGLGGNTFLVQGAALSSAARNGVFVTTNAHRLQLQ